MHHRTILWLFLGTFGLRSWGAQLWFYAAENLAVDERVGRLEGLLHRAGKCGYTHLLLADSKFCRLGEMHPGYFRNVERVKRAATGAGIEIVPAVFPVGYANDLLWHDPDLAEGPPVKDAQFVVRGGIARLESDTPTRLKGGDFTDLMHWDWKDDTVVADAGTARISDPRGANARIVQKLVLTPWRQYHLSVRIKTSDFRGTPEVKVLAGREGRALSFDNLGVAKSQDWKLHHVVFNSLSYTNANLYLGAWGATTGSLWWDDAAIEEIGLLNLVRRDGAPFVVKTADGRVLSEAQDFDAVHDPRMGHVQWAGDYDVFHEPPVIRMKGAWPDGTVLRISYQHVASIYDGQVMIDLAEPKALELLRDQARRMHATWGARGYMMSHDEIRVLGWSEAFRRRGLTPGQLLAENVRECTKILRAVNPGGRIYVWSDMFDPNHNAVKGPYYLVNGPLEGSWDGLDPDVTLLNWNFGQRERSLKFFADRGHHQVIAGYYDGPPEQIGRWLTAAKPYPGVEAVMYTTWRGDYGALEKFAELVRSAAP